MKKIVMLLSLVALTAPAAAADYYVVRGPDKKCRVVETRPADKTVVVVGDTVYTTREEAEKQIKVVCKESPLPGTASV